MHLIYGDRGDGRGKGQGEEGKGQRGQGGQGGRARKSGMQQLLRNS